MDETPPNSNAPSPNTSPGGLNASPSNQAVVLPMPQKSDHSGLPGGDYNFGGPPPPPIQMPTSPPLALPAPSSSSAPEEAATGPPLDENDHKYVGLVNQAMTCYLNSLVQTLYMTPEFRNSIYKWEYKSKTPDTSIPCQIQRLFLLLQTSDRSAMETTELTKSFGWTSAEAYEQHDVQELCRLMFDALEHRWKGTPHQALIPQLYRGEMQDFVRCLTCKNENTKKDEFLDLPLAVKNFGAVDAFRSVEEALQAFITPERLEGSNQYHCERCNAKRDADKGLRVTRFPYLLTIQLKRFDFDYNTMHRVKLNDKMTFPDVLNLNPYVFDPDGPERPNPEGPADVLYCGTPVAGKSLDKGEVQRLLKQGPNVYELFSVMVHQGSAAGGHYYAYIKNLDQDRWHCFNDSRVDFAKQMEIEKSWGGLNGGWSNSNTNAYMLMYRQVNPANQKFMRTPELPKHIIQLQNQWRKKEEEEERQRAYVNSLVYITVELNFACESEDLVAQKFTMETPRTSAVGEVFNGALKFFEEKARQFKQTLGGRNNARLIRCGPDYRMYYEYVSKNDLEKKLEGCFVGNEVQCGNKDLLFLLDVKRGGSRFVLSPQKPRTIAVSRVDIRNRTVWPPLRINLTPQHNKVLLVKKVIGAAFGDNQHQLITARLVVQQGDNASKKFKLLDQPQIFIDHALADCFSNPPLVYYDGGEENDDTSADRQRMHEESIMFETLDRKRFAMIIKLRLPDKADVSRTAMLCTAFAGPSWRETVVHAPPPTAAATNNNSNHGEEDNNENAAPPGLQNSVINELNETQEMESTSGRSTPVSIEDDVMLGTDSLCNNTPQMSPTVSDQDEGFGDEQRIINQDHRSLATWNLAEDSVENNAWNAPRKPWDSTNSINMADNESMAPSDPGTASVADSMSTVVANILDDSRDVILVQRSELGLSTIDADSRVTVAYFKAWLAKYFQLDVNQFVLTVHHTDDLGDKGYDSCATDSDCLSTFNNLNWLEVKLRPPMNNDEKLIRVNLFDTQEKNKDDWKFLFDVPAGRKTLVGDFLLQCLRLYQEIFCDEIDYRQIRLRDLGSTSKSILNPESTFENARTLSSWNTPVYLQIVKDEKIAGKPGDPVFVRRFRPSTAEVGPIHEVLLDASSSHGFAQLLHAIAEYSGIPVEFVEITEPPLSQWEFGKWPYAKSRLEMLDGTVRFVNKQPLQLANDFLTKIGCRVVYYRDSREKAKELSEDEKKQITIKDNSVSSNASATLRRKERPLRIQMSSFSES